MQEISENSQKQLLPLEDFMSSKVKKKQLFETNFLSNKRQKMDQQEGRKILILSPLFAIFLHFSNRLLDLEWAVRQSSAISLNAFFTNNESCIPFSYAIVEVNEEEEVKEEETKETETPSRCQIVTKEVPQIKLLQNDVYLKALIFTFKDNFEDYSDSVNQIPTRIHAVWLLRNLFPKIYDSDRFIRSLPTIFRDSEDHGKWQTTYNFFLICKAVVATELIENKFFEVFRKVLVEAFKVLEENNKILIAQLIKKILKKFLQDKDLLPDLLRNLQNNLLVADDIDQSPKEMFDLYSMLLENQGQGENQVDLSLFDFNLKAFYPFNFHKFSQVRLSYLKIVNKILILWKPNDLKVKRQAFEQLLILTCQSLIMEREKDLLKQLKINLELILRDSEEQVVTQLLDKMLSWVFKNRIEGFADFQFYENEKFLTIDKDYYQILTRPVTPEEIFQDRYARIHNSSHVFSMFITKLPNLQYTVLGRLFQKVEHEPGKEILHHESWLAVLKTFYLSTKQPEIDPNPQIQNIIENLLEVDENRVHFLFYTEFKSFIKSFNSYIKNSKVHASVLCEELKQLNSEFEALFKAIKESGGKGDVKRMRQVHDKIIEKVSDQQKKLGPVYDHASVMQDEFHEFFKYSENITQRVRALCAASSINLLVFHGKQIEKKNPIIQPILISLKKEDNIVLQKVSCKALVDFVIFLSQKGGNEAKLCEKIVKNTTQQLEKLSGSFDKTISRGNQIFYKQLFQKCFNQDFSFLEIGCQYFKKYIQQENQRNEAYFYACNFILKQSFEALNKDKCELVFGPIIEQVIQNCFTFINMEGGEDREVSYQLLHKIFFLIPSQSPKIISQLAKSLENQQSARRAFMVLEHILNISNSIDVLLPPQKENEPEHPKPKDFWLTEASKVGMSRSEAELKQVLKYLKVFVIPVIKNLSRSAEIFDGDKKRVISILARVLQLLPFNLDSIEQVESELEDQAREGHKFLQTFVRGAMQEEYKIDHVKVNCQLRRYQLEGITWMATLSSYNLNFALCDDMGLGKTVQTLCLILNESAKRQVSSHSKEQRPGPQALQPSRLPHHAHPQLETRG